MAAWLRVHSFRKWWLGDIFGKYTLTILWKTSLPEVGIWYLVEAFVFIEEFLNFQGYLGRFVYRLCGNSQKGRKYWECEEDTVKPKRNKVLAYIQEHRNMVWKWAETKLGNDSEVIFAIPLRNNFEEMADNSVGRDPGI